MGSVNNYVFLLRFLGFYWVITRCPHLNRKYKIMMRGVKKKELRCNYAEFKKQVKHLMEVAHKMVES